MKNRIIPIIFATLLIVSMLPSVIAEKPDRTEFSYNVGLWTVQVERQYFINSFIDENGKSHNNYKGVSKFSLYNPAGDRTDNVILTSKYNYLDVESETWPGWYFQTSSYMASKIGYDLINGKFLVYEEHEKYLKDELRFCKGELC